MAGEARLPRGMVINVVVRLSLIAVFAAAGCQTPPSASAGALGSTLKKQKPTTEKVDQVDPKSAPSSGPSWAPKAPESAKLKPKTATKPSTAVMPGDHVTVTPPSKGLQPHPWDS